MGDALDELVLVDLVGDLGDDDGLASAGDVFDLATGARMKWPRPGAVGLADAGVAVEDSGGGEVGAEDVLEDERSRSDFVSCRDFDRTAMQALTTSVRLRGGMLVAMPTVIPPPLLTMRLGMRAGRMVGSTDTRVVVGSEVDGVVVDVGEHLTGDAGEA